MIIVNSITNGYDRSAYLNWTGMIACRTRIAALDNSKAIDGLTVGS
jgi:hypothetical protein